MKNIIAIIAALIALTFCKNSALADGNTPEQSKAVKEFKIDGLDMNTTLQTIREKFPSVTHLVEESHTRIGYDVYNLEKTQNTDGIKFAFFDGKMTFLRATYLTDRLNKMSGWETILEKLVAKLGKGDADSRGSQVDKTKGEIMEVDWNFKDLNRYFRFNVDQKLATLTIYDMTLIERFQEKKKATAETGF